MSGDDVAQLQRALAGRGYYQGAVDGRFGAQTRAGVVAFQRAHGLPADGVAGPRTLAALGLTGQPASSEPTGQPGTIGSASAISVHIGVNSVNPAAYGGWAGALAGCENDARTMTRIAQAEGFSTSQLFTPEATSQNVLGAIANAARQLRAGGMFLLTYAGHGGQVPNVSNDDELDQQDETWVLYDRMLLDDELSDALTAFQTGVNVVLLSDSCHSGTVYRYEASAEFATIKRSFYENLGVGRALDGLLGAIPHPVLEVPAGVAAREPESRPNTEAGSAVAVTEPVMAVSTSRSTETDGDAEHDGLGDTLQTREMPYLVNEMTVRDHSAEYREIQERVRSRGSIAASGVSISGCQDNQLSQEVSGAGVFTTTLNRVWQNGAFTGSYEAMHRAIVGQMGPNQTPELGLFGTNPEAVLARTPFNP